LDSQKWGMGIFIKLLVNAANTYDKATNLRPIRSGFYIKKNAYFFNHTPCFHCLKNLSIAD
jgi:hypothetical protein